VTRQDKISKPDPWRKGRQRRDHGKLFHEFHLDDRIPKNHLPPRIDVFVTAAIPHRPAAQS